MAGGNDFDVLVGGGTFLETNYRRNNRGGSFPCRTRLLILKAKRFNWDAMDLVLDDESFFACSDVDVG